MQASNTSLDNPLAIKGCSKEMDINWLRIFTT